MRRWSGRHSAGELHTSLSVIPVVMHVLLRLLSNLSTRCLCSEQPVDIMTNQERYVGVLCAFPLALWWYVL
jgi:hypothetical protein